MGEAVQKKTKTKNENEKNGEGGGGGKKKEENPLTVVLKVDMHCEGCANKIIKCVKGFEGVQTVKSETEGNKLTVVGKIDPSKLREKLYNKTKKKVELVSPQPKKEKDSKPDDASNNNKSDKKTDEKKKPKEPPVTTAVLKVALHCQGCIEKIHRVTSKFKGVAEMSVDRQKDLVTVKGTMDVKALSESLTERLKRPVVIVPAKKEKEKNNNKDGDGGGKTEAGGDGEKKSTEGGGGGKKKKKGGTGPDGGAGGGEGGGNGWEEGGAGGGGWNGKMEGNKMEYMPMAGAGYGFGYGYGCGYGLNYGYGYGPGGLVGEHLHAPQIFSDENPNACSIM